MKLLKEHVKKCNHKISFHNFPLYSKCLVVANVKIHLPPLETLSH